MNNNQTVFTMNASKEAFQILSSNLYSNPILAVIRELACNSNDANIESGSEKPSTLHIPTTDEQFFDIRDYGPGIPEDLIYNIYTSYFVSTKTTDENQTGCFGLGSKTPFALVDSYIVISYCEGMKKTYLMKKVDGLPVVEKISEEPSSETGLEIYFDIPVSNYVALRWKQEAIEFFKGTSFLPNINVINEDPDFDWDEYGEERAFYSNDNIAFSSNRSKEITANVAGVNFRVELSSLKDAGKDIETAMNSAGIYKINIMTNKNDVTITPSRESLHFDDKTINFVRNKITTLVNDYFDKIRQNVDNIDYKTALKIISVNKFARDVNEILRGKIHNCLFDRTLLVRNAGKGKTIRVSSAETDNFNGYYSSPKITYLVDCSEIKQTVKKNVVDNFFTYQNIDGDKITSTAFCNVVKNFTSSDENSLVVFVKNYEVADEAQKCKDFLGSDKVYYIKWSDYVDIKKEASGMKRGFKTRSTATFIGGSGDNSCTYGYGWGNNSNPDLKDDEVGLIVPGDQVDTGDVRTWTRMFSALNINYKWVVRPCIESVYKKYKEKGFKTPEQYATEILENFKDKIKDDLIALKNRDSISNVFNSYYYDEEIEKVINLPEFDELANLDESFKNLRTLYTKETFEKADKADSCFRKLNLDVGVLPTIDFSNYPLFEFVRNRDEPKAVKAFFEYALMYCSQKKTAVAAA